ncbi:MAG: hypothetical protein H0T85_01275 [Geodermatophilaceae bacterium]|nr:hypothetical protein [Geodermatophilaceae bacterium]
MGAAAAVFAVALLTVSACGGGSTSSATPNATGTPAEVNPAGDIPDDQAFVPYTPPAGLFTVSVPEGWGRSEEGGATTFTDKLNSIRVETVPRASAPDVDTATAEELPQISASSHNYTAGQVSIVTRTAGDAVLITYSADSAPDPVTGKVVTDAVERYEFWRAGQEVVLTLSGPTGADNVDPWRIVTDSVTWAP